MSARKVQNLIERDGWWYFKKVVNGKPYIRSTDTRVGGAAALARAEKLAKKFETEIWEGRWGFAAKTPKVVTTVGAWCDKFVGAHKSQVAKMTHANLANTARHLKETEIDGATWAMRDIETITETDCRAMLTAMQFKALKSANSRRTFHTIAGGIFQAAVNDGVLTKNPWRFKRAKGQPRERVLSKAEEEAVQPFLDDYYKRAMTLEILAGLRIGCELAALKIGDVDFERRQVHVRNGKGSRKRFVPLAAKAAVVIREQLALNAVRRPGAINVTPTMHRRMEQGYIFPISPRRVLDAWHLAADSANIERFTSHDLRRTYGTRMAEGGVPMKRLQVWMGHSSITVTAQFYVHLDRESDTAYLERVIAQLEAEGGKGQSTEASTVDLKVVKS